MNPNNLPEHTANVLSSIGVKISPNLIYYELRRNAKAKPNKKLNPKAIKLIDQFLSDDELEMVYINCPEVLSSAYEISLIIQHFENQIDKTRKLKIEKAIPFTDSVDEKTKDLIFESIDKELEPKRFLTQSLFHHFSVIMKNIAPIIINSNQTISR